MTLFEFLVPLGALAVAGVGILFIRHSGRKLDSLERQKHPAE